jgi:glycosyltransferase involved in cell wall biosynthesis
MHGPARYVRTLASGLASRGVDTHVLSAHPTRNEDLIENGFTVHLRTAPRFAVISRFQPGIGESFHIWKAFESLNRQYGFDLVEFTNVEGVGFVSTVLSNVPTVIRAHTTAFDACRLGIGIERLERRYARLERWTAGRATKVVTHTVSHRRQIAADYGLLENAIALVPHGVDPIPAPSHVARKAQQIICVGTASLRKGVAAFLIGADLLVREFPEMRFVWIGTDTPSAPRGQMWREHAAERFPRLAANLEFRPALSDSELATLYRESTCYLCTASYESFGLTLVEAMFAELPVIAPKTAAMADLISDGRTGILYEPGDIDDLVAKVRALVSSPETRERLSAAAAQLAWTEYTAEKMTSRMMELYADVC